MGLKMAYQLTCVCGNVFMEDIYEYVFADFDPDLKEAILAGVFNCTVCPECETALYAETRFVYRDGEKKIWVWVCKEDDNIEDKFFVDDVVREAFLPDTTLRTRTTTLYM